MNAAATGCAKPWARGDAMTEFFHMSGYGPYVWSAYAIGIGALVLNVWLARRQLRIAREQARRRLAMKETS